ncbi:methylenetetrahydrofolate reductase [NAD(P)H] [Puniceicoccaceae bacterium K14]|nr:methylenetetrahydrofolate reductase [NAD(P)H] [Puniceicoccaceae bacterium K14]
MKNNHQAPISDLFKNDKPLLSVEFFPPKSEEAVDSLIETARRINVVKPDFASVTYGAGGSTRSRSADVSRRMKDEIGLNIMPHFTCVGATREELGEILDEFYAEGYRNIMTLRGDPPKGEENFVVTEGGFAYASDLVGFINKRYPDICMGVAGYPEKHPEAASLESDIEKLKIKVDAGAAFITTQLFFDNDYFYRYVDLVRKSGIEIPIVPGIMPVLALKQIKRITELSNAHFPKNLEQRLAAVDGDKEAVRQVGVDWAHQQMADLITQGVPGIHLYAMNKAQSAIDLLSAFRKEYPSD